MTGWARLRQVVIGTADLAAASTLLREGLGLPPGFADPELHQRGLADECIPVGPDHFLELVAPLDPGGATASPLDRWLARTGGGGGYCLSIQVPDADAALVRAAATGVRMVVNEVVLGHRIVQLHPADLGILAEADGIADRDRWFWDDVSPGPAPDALVDAVLAVELATPDPEAMAARWATIYDVGRPTPTSIDLDAIVRFVEGPSRLVAVDLRARGGGGPDVVVHGITLRRVAADTSPAAASC